MWKMKSCPQPLSPKVATVNHVFRVLAENLFSAFMSTYVRSRFNIYTKKTALLTLGCFLLFPLANLS